jgi:hypothetical protein
MQAKVGDVLTFTCNIYSAYSVYVSFFINTVYQQNVYRSGSGDVTFTYTVPDTLSLGSHILGFHVNYNSLTTNFCKGLSDGSGNANDYGNRVLYSLQLFDTSNYVNITSIQPSNINESTESALYTMSYNFTGTATVGSIVWSITPTTYGNINSSTGALTLTFPQGVTSSGTFVVTATGHNGASAIKSWTFTTTAPPLAITSTQPANINESTETALYTKSYSFTGTASVGSIVWSLTPTKYGNIDSSTGALTLTFPLGTTEQGTFVVTATDLNGSVTKSWTYTVLGVLIKQYPPADLNIGWETTTSTTLSGQLWGNGTYTVSGTSQYNSQLTPGELFNYSGSTPWMSGGNYNTSTGLYAGGQTTTVDGVGYAGEWVQIKFPYAIIPVYFTILSKSTLNRNPKSVIVAGSVDGSTWVTIYMNESSTTDPFRDGPSIYVAQNSGYKFLRCIILTVPPNVWGAFEITEWKIYSGTSGPIFSYTSAPLLDNVYTVSGSAYGNGLHTCSESSYEALTLSAFRMFDKNNGYEKFWMSANRYTQQGAYTGSSNTLVGSSTISGEWAQIQLPLSIALISYSLAGRYAQDNAGIYHRERRSPRTWFLAGSTDGSSWTLINANSQAAWNEDAPKVVVLPSTAPQYSYFRVIVTEVGQASLSDCTHATISELVLNAY